MIVVVLGGSRSGKSELAERWAASLGAPVTYLATYRTMRDSSVNPGIDEDMARRIDAHRQRRPSDWATREVAEDLPAVLAVVAGTVLLDSLGTWIAAHQDFSADVEGLCAALGTRSGHAVVVSDEVGLGVHPETALGRRFRDALGGANRAVAEVADRCVLVVAGRVLELRPAESVWP
ncbi:MAG: bifunctional adenosylcobinamide kinase/adenosylcobinamide-phosphate guanylyltransferase [Acidimicrobiales bacterium]